MVEISVRTGARDDMVDITADVGAAIAELGVDEGAVLVWVPHTTAAVTVNEGADPDVVRDIKYELDKIVPWEDAYRHLEGNSPAHVKASIIGPSEIIAVEGGRLKLGTWQGVFFCEFDGPRTRKIHVRML